MSSIQGKNSLSFRRVKTEESSSTPIISKDYEFAHESVGGETFIDIDALVEPTSIDTGIINPTGAALASLNLLNNASSLIIISSVKGTLMKGSWLVSASGRRINLVFSTDANEIFTAQLRTTQATANVVDAESYVCTGTLVSGGTDIPLGQAFTLNANSNQQIGEITLHIDGIQQFRNVGNVAAAPAADGNYEEVDAGAGLTNILRLNQSFATDIAYAITSTGLIVNTRDKDSISQQLESLGGQIDALVPTVADLAGVPESDFQAGPNDVDLKAFANKVYANGVDIGTNTSDISTNTGNILSNTNNINANTLNIGTNTSVISNPNVLINGNFDVWQRGTTSTVSGIKTVDRWFSTPADGVHTSSQGVFTLGQTDVPHNPKYYHRYEQTIASTVPFSFFGQKIENPERFSGQTITLSFWAKASSSFTLFTDFTAIMGGVNVLDSIGSSHTVTTSWQKFTLTETFTNYASGATSASTDSLALRFLPSSWTSLFTVDIAQVKVEVSSTATRFIPKSFADELQACQRYCEVIFKNSKDYSYVCSRTSSTLLELSYIFRVEKRKDINNLYITDVGFYGRDVGRTASYGLVVANVTNFVISSSGDRHIGVFTLTTAAVAAGNVYSTFDTLGATNDIIVESEL